MTGGNEQNFEIAQNNHAIPQRKKELSLKTLKQSEINKIMAAFEKGKEAANQHYINNIESKIIKRTDIYEAKKEHYKQKFPMLSQTSNWISKDVKTTIDWLVPSLMEVFIGSDDPIDIQGASVEDDSTAKKIQALLKYQVERKNNYFTFLYPLIKEGLKTNYSVAKVYWRREEEVKRMEVMANVAELDQYLTQHELNKIDIKAIEPLDAAGELYRLEYDRTVVKANYPVLESLPPSELRFTPDSNNLQNAKFVAHRKIVSGDYLKRKEQEGIYQDVDKALKDAGNVQRTNLDTKNNPDNDKRLNDNDSASKEVELYEAYIKVDYNNDGIYELLIVHVVGKVPLRIAKNDFEMPPFFVWSPEYNPYCVFGDESYADTLEQLQDIKTALIRQVITATAKNNSPQRFVNVKGVDMEALIENEETVPVSDFEGDISTLIFYPPPINISPLAMTLVEYAQSEIESQSGSTRYNQGLDSNSLNKMLALDTPILMADGTFKLNKDIVAGDRLIGSNGSSVKVVTAHPIQMPKRAFEITFQSGDVIKAGGEHRWAVKICDKNHHHMSPEFEKLPTERIFDLIQTGHKAYIPRVGKVNFDEKDLPLDPYIFGLWLGDGNAHTNRFTTMDDEIKHAFEAWTKQFYKGCIEPCKQQHSGKAITYAIVNTPFRQMLKDMKCLKDSRYFTDNVKHVPEEYLQGSFEQRLSLLQGLMDTDGCIDKNGNAIFCNSEPRLIEGVILLIESLGGKPNVNWKNNVGNKFKNARPHAHITFSMPYCPVRLARKVARWKTRSSYWNKQRIVSIKEIEVEPMRCLTVDAKDELYVCGRRLTLTSNTATGITAIMGAADKRMKLLARIFAETLLIPLFKFLILLNQKYLDDEQVFRLMNENIVIRKEELSIDYDLVVNVGQGAGTKEASIQYLMILINQIYPILQQNGIVDSNSWFNITKELLEKMGMRNVTSYLMDPSSPAAQQKQQMAAGQMQQQAAQQVQAQKELLAEKNKPRLSVNFKDLPVEAKQAFLASQGANVPINSIAQKEIMDKMR